MNDSSTTSPATGRSCGPCTACCTHLPIPAEIVGPRSKAAGTPCPYVGRYGCRVYARRPRVCADFTCAWLKNTDWPEPWRPDRSGVMCLSEQIDTHLFASAVYEIRPGALQTPSAAEIIGQLRRTTAAVVLISSDRQTRHCLLGGHSADDAHAGVPAPHYELGREPESALLPQVRTASYHS
jgi:hypothetical protein